jgi:ribosomal protein S18 acetylase RimI-like enzyme
VATAGPGFRVRHARAADVEALVELRMAELRYAALVGPAVVRPGAREVMAAEVTQAMRFGAQLWLAEESGVPVGMAACTIVSPRPDNAVEGRLRPGDWGYFDTLAVAPEARHRGVGRALAAAAQGELLRAGVRGIFLFYHVANPLSPVFWHRQGYRPLWTTWARQPAWS